MGSGDSSAHYQFLPSGSRGSRIAMLQSIIVYTWQPQPCPLRLLLRLLIAFRQNWYRAELSPDPYFSIQGSRASVTGLATLANNVYKKQGAGPRASGRSSPGALALRSTLYQSHFIHKHSTFASVCQVPPPLEPVHLQSSHCAHGMTPPINSYIAHDS